MPQPSTPYLHIYGQWAHHDPVYLVGTRDGLMALIYTLLDALLGRDRQHRTLFTADGEGYELRVTLVPEETEVQAYAAPYTADWLRDPEAEASPTWPRKMPTAGGPHA
jgi:hypothetical protein